jgi:hypothetical protein
VLGGTSSEYPLGSAAMPKFDIGWSHELAAIVQVMYFQCTILRQVVVMGAGIGESVWYRSESPSRRMSAAKLHITQQLK